VEAFRHNSCAGPVLPGSSSALSSHSLARDGVCQRVFALRHSNKCAKSYLEGHRSPGNEDASSRWTLDAGCAENAKRRKAEHVAKRVTMTRSEDGTVSPIRDPNLLFLKGEKVR